MSSHNVITELDRSGHIPGTTVQLQYHELSSTTVAADVLVIPVTHAFVSKTTGADAEALTLADGQPGQVLTVSLTTAGGGAGTLTPATCTGFATVIFLGAKDTATFLFVDSTIGWTLIGAYGTDAPPVIS